MKKFFDSAWAGILIFLLLCVFVSCSGFGNSGDDTDRTESVMGEESVSESDPESNTDTDSETESREETESDPPRVFDPENWAPEIVDCSKTRYSYEEMAEDLAVFGSRYPEYFSYREIGSSLDGRAIYAATLGNPDARRQILVTAGIHAREYVTSWLVMTQLEYYLDYYEIGSLDGKPFSELFRDTAIVVVPMCNPDGIMLAEEGIASVVHEDVRKTLLAVYESDKKCGFTASSSGMDGYFRTWKANLAGVDLNRNYPTEAWDSYHKMYSPSMQNFKGYTPGSEPETRALMSLLTSLSDPVASLCIHSQGEVIYWDCGQTGKVRNESYALAKLAAGLTGYSMMFGVHLDASFSDWCSLNQEVPSITIEIGDGGGSSLLPVDQLPIIFAANRDFWAKAAAH